MLNKARSHPGGRLENARLQMEEWKSISIL